MEVKFIDDPIVPMSKLRLATNNFSEENLMKQSPSVVLYKGQLTQSGESIPIVVRRYTNPDVSFNEAMISLNHIHKNIATLFKVASEDLADDDDDFEILDGDTRVNLLSQGYHIYKYEENESLDKHLSGSTLTWMQRLHICLDVAEALCYIHNELPQDESMIHGNIKSSKIWLNQNWEPTLHGLRLGMIAKKHGAVQHPNNFDGTLQYTDPAYEKTKALSHKSDVYSFGVVLFEVLLGRVASIPISDDNKWSFARFARSHYEQKTLSDIIDPVLRQQMDPQSLKIFSETAYYCLQELRFERPDMIMVVKKLESSLDYQQKLESPEHSTTASFEAPLSDRLKEKNLDHLRISLSDIRLATDNFSETYRIGSGGYGTVYRAELNHFDGSHSSTTEGVVRDDFTKRKSTVAIKRILNRVDKQGEQGFLAEIEMLSNCKHQNVVSLLGFCDEGDEMILIYEYISKGSLDDYLGDHDKLINLTWAQRMQICLGIAHGLHYLHTSTKDKRTIIHRDIKSANVLLDDNWVAKIGDFGLSKLNNTYQQSCTLVTKNIAGTEVYLDPEYASTGRLKKESDVYSLGVVLFEIMCGRLAYDNIYYVNNEKGLASVTRRCFNDGTLKDMVDPRLMEADENLFMLNGRLNQDSLDKFTKIAYRCIAETQVMRPTMQDVINELQKAIQFQEDHEIWEPKLPRDYQEILESSKIEKDHEIWDRDEYGRLDSSEIKVRNYSKKRWYELLWKGILLKEGTTWVSLGSIYNRDISEIISATNFLFKKNSLRNWQSTPESRFSKVAKMLTISNLKINVRIRTQFLSPRVKYGVHLVFKFCGSRKSSSTPLYVNLRYKMGKEIFHAYFATWRDEEWMKIELSRFLNHKKDTEFQVLLESFSQYYCERNGICVEGIEFRPIHDVQQVFKSNTDMVQVQQLATDSEEICNRSSNDDEGEKVLSLNEVNEKKHLMLSAKDILHDTSNVKRFYLKPSEEPRFQEVIELLPQQVFGLKYKIESQMLLRDTDYMCYLVFKLTEKCHGLHCPVKVRDVLHWKNKEIGILYFRTPDSWNIHDNHRVPQKREDGWMEVIVWKFNSTFELRNAYYIPMHLKLIAYEGTMSGLTVGGLEIRPI